MTQIGQIFFGSKLEKLKDDCHQCATEIDDGLENEEVLKEVTMKRKLYSLKQSSSSCKLSDIQGFIFGGLTSRFWMLRKHINSLSSEYFKKHTLPFYSWDCITLQLAEKEVYLVIKNEK